MKEGNVNKVMQKTDVEKDLGVWTSKDGKPSMQCARAATKAMSVLRSIKRTFSVVTVESFDILYRTFVRPHLEYCVQAWSPYLVKDIECLEKVQRRATRLVKGIRDLPYERRLDILNLYPLSMRRIRGDLIETFKILKGIDHVDPSTFFQMSHTSHLRGHSLKLFKKRSRTVLRRNFFSNRVVDQWNQLPDDVIDADTVNSFKNRLDRHWKSRQQSKWALKGW